MSQSEVLTAFKTQLLAFIDELLSQFPLQGELVVLRIYLDNQIPIKNAMDNFNLKLNQNDQEVKKLIKSRSDSIFTDHSLFSSSKKETNVFKTIWISGNLDNDDKEVIWNWIDTFVFLADKYTQVLNK